MQQMQEVSTHRVVLGLHMNTLAVVAVVIPVAQHRAEGGNELVGNIAGTGDVVIVLLRQHAQSRIPASGRFRCGVVFTSACPQAGMRCRYRSVGMCTNGIGGLSGPSV